MKLSELIDQAQTAIETYGDLDVCVPCPDEGIDDELCDANLVKVRSRGSPYIDQKRWDIHDRQLVFVVAA
jgi:hypothetical protein